MHKPHIRIVPTRFGSAWGVYATRQSRKPFMMSSNFKSLCYGLSAKQRILGYRMRAV